MSAELAVRPLSAVGRNRLISTALLITAVLAASGCTTVGPDYRPPELDLPENFTTKLDRGLRQGDPSLRAWWKKFSDPTLDQLVERATEGNLSLKEALSRIREARAFRGVAETELVPFVDLSGNYTRSQSSREIANGAFVPRTNDLFQLGFDAGWEIDFWGRVRRSVEVEDAEIGASVEDARDVLVTLTSEVAATYVELRSLQERVEIAESNLGRQEQTLKLTKDRFDAGLVSELDVAQASTILESTRASIPTLRGGAQVARNRLSVLLGETPGSLDSLLRPFVLLAPPKVEVAVGIPAELLRRRPDIRFSERRLAAQTARIGVATAELYPRFSLSGSLGLSAENAGDLFKRNATGFTLGPSFTWNVFDRSRLRSNIEIENARQEQALISYENTVLLALEEVENGMIGFVQSQRAFDALLRAVDHSRRSLELSREQYRQGLVDFQSVLDTQGRLFDIEDQLASTRSAISASLIVLYKALGGGWAESDIILVPAAPTPETES